METNGVPADSLKISSEFPDLTLATPAALSLTTNDPAVEVIETSGQIRQVKAPQALADIVTNTAFNYEIRYYLPFQVGSKVDGIYQMTGSPYVTWTIENPDASTNIYSRLRITETRDSETYIYDYTNIASQGWMLDYPGGLREDQVTKATIITTNLYVIEEDEPTNMTNEVHSVTCVVTNIVRAPGGPVEFKSIRIYQQDNELDYDRFAVNVGPGYEITENQAPLTLTQETLDPDGNPQTTTYVYYTSDEILDVATPTFVPLEMVVHPDGSWQYYIYDDSGRVTDVYSGSGDVPAPDPDVGPESWASRHVSYSYAPVSGDDDGSQFPNSPRTTVEYLTGC